MYRFICVVAGSVVPLTVKSSQSVTVSGAVIVGGQSKVILTDAPGSDSEDSCPSIIAVAVRVKSPLPKAGSVGSSIISHVAGSPSPPGVMSVVLVKRFPSMYRFICVVAGFALPLTIKSSQSVTVSGAVIVGGQSYCNRYLV